MASAVPESVAGTGACNMAIQIPTEQSNLKNGVSIMEALSFKIS